MTAIAIIAGRYYRYARHAIVAAMLYGFFFAIYMSFCTFIIISNAIWSSTISMLNQTMCFYFYLWFILSFYIEKYSNINSSFLIALRIVFIYKIIIVRFNWKLILIIIIIYKMFKYVYWLHLPYKINCYVYYNM